MKISFNRLDLRTQLLKGASPLAGETPATAIARMAGFAAVSLFGFMRRAMSDGDDNERYLTPCCPLRDTDHVQSHRS